MKRLVNSFAGMFGYKVVRASTPASQNYGLSLFFELVKKLGFRPKHVLDVGANHGAWTRTAIGYFPEAQYTLVEPQEQLKTHIQDLEKSGHKIRWISAGVADQPGKLPLVISERDDSSSFAVSAEKAREMGLRTLDIEVKTINEIVADTKGPIPEMVKIDAEGFDLKALAGATDLFGKTEIFLVEVVVCAPDYENTIARVIRVMDERGYRVIDITDINRSPKHGVLWLCELGFLRKGSSLLREVTSYE